MTQTLAQRVIQLNNEAIASSLKGFRQDGVITLQRALAVVASIQESNAESRRTESLPLAQSVPLSQPQCSKPFDDVFQFFNRAIIIPADDDMTLSGPHSRTRIQATILFNLGVLCHQEAICSGSSSIAFAHALQFYGGAYQVLETAQGFPPRDALLLILALFNNMGHIYSSFCMDSHKARQCVSWMQSAFAAPMAQHALAPEDYTFFGQYISVRAEEQLLLSPAA